MRFIDLTPQDKELVKEATNLIKRRRSKRSAVGAALRTVNDKIFRGVNIEVECSAPCSICAEYAAIGTMVTEGECEIDTIVAVSYKSGVLPPCGQCRQFLSEFGDPYVIVRVDDQLKKAKLRELFPLPVTSK
jgi:cytidine deaminase